jgi:hypothetical protein
VNDSNILTIVAMLRGNTVVQVSILVRVL